MQQETTFTIIIDGQEILVHYQPRYFITADRAHFEFTSPYEPRCRIPISETGYLSHFSHQHEVEAALSVKEYAYMLALALMGDKPVPAEDEQMLLF